VTPKDKQMYFMNVIQFFQTNKMFKPRKGMRERNVIISVPSGPAFDAALGEWGYEGMRHVV
jgi:hypothetical protein